MSHYADSRLVPPEPQPLPRNVLLVLGYLWGGGAEWHALHLACTLRRLGPRVETAYVYPGTPDATDRWAQYGVPTLKLSSPKALASVTGRGYDLVHAHLFKGEVAGAVASAALGVPLVVTRHSLDWHNLPAWQRAVLTELVHRRASGIIAVSEAVAGVTREALGGRHLPVRVIHHGLDRRLLRDRTRGTDIRRQLHLEGKPLLGTAARLSPDKGLTHLLVAFAQALPHLTRWHLLIAGDGPERAGLAELADQLRIRDRVHLLGWREDVVDIVASLDLFVLPSIREGFGLALLEALALGVPSIASDLPSIREAGGDAVVYVPPADPAALAEAILRMALQPELRRQMASGAPAQADRFSAETMARQTLDFYRQVSASD